MLWTLAQSAAWLLIHIPGFVIGFLLTLALGLISLFLALYFFILGPPKPSTESPIESDGVPFDRRPKLSDSQSTPQSSDSSSFMLIPSRESDLNHHGDLSGLEADSFQCGWLYITADYECPPKVNVSSFGFSTDTRHRVPPRSIFFGMIKERQLYLYEGEAQVKFVADSIIGMWHCAGSLE
jgi:hypothetical protein